MKKRALSLLMSLVMLVSMLPTTAWAAEENVTTNEIEIALENCTEVGKCGADDDTADPVYLFNEMIPKGKTTVSFVDFQDDEGTMVATTVADSSAMETGHKAPINRTMQWMQHIVTGSLMKDLQRPILSTAMLMEL